MSRTLTVRVNERINADTAADVDAAVAAVRNAIEGWAATSREPRLAALACNTPAALGRHFQSAYDILHGYAFDEDMEPPESWRSRSA